VLAAGFVLSMIGLPAMGQARPSGKAHARTRLAMAAETTLQKGPTAKLPPHLATLLGLSQEKECLVKQGVVRNGTVVRGLDVSLANKKDIVLFVVNETANDQTLYLTSADGRLRRVVSVTSGEGRVSQITDQDKKAFEQEKQFWVDRLAPALRPK
jgi:hypothetical protein